jgi:hypothetical protein
LRWQEIIIGGIHAIAGGPNAGHESCHVLTMRSLINLRFNTRQLLIAMASIAFILTLSLAYWDAVNGDYDDLRLALASDSRIQDLRITPYNDGLFNLTKDAWTVSFSIAGKPGSFVSITCPDRTILSETGSICLNALGPFQLITRQDLGGATSISGADVGDESELRDVLPITVSNFDELIRDYDILLKAVSNWPRWNGGVKTRGGKLEYFAELRRD